MFEPGTNQLPVHFHFDLRFTISILFRHALVRVADMYCNRQCFRPFSPFKSQSPKG